MDSFDPVLLFNTDYSFEEKSVYVLDELSQVRALEDNMRRCFSLRIASRIVALIQMHGAVSEENNFISVMDKLTKRFAVLFNAAYDFLNIDALHDDHIYVIQMMNNAIIDFMTNEYRLKAAGITTSKDFDERELNDFLKAILISQNKDFSSFSSNGEVEFVNSSPLLSSDNVRRVSIASAVIKFHGLGNVFDYFQPDFNSIVRYLLNELMTVTESQIKEVSQLNNSVPISFAMVAEYYSNNVGLICEVYKRVAKEDAMKIKRMSSIDKSVIIARYKQEGMAFLHIGAEYRKASRQVTDHIEFLMGVYYNEFHEDA